MIILLIVASGKSSRFGGFPKAFCNLGDRTNLDNTIEKAGKIFDKIYVGVNNKTYRDFRDSIHGCEVISISTGQGDAHSLLKCLNIIREREESLNRIVVCWGDAVFIDSSPFEQLIRYTGSEPVIVACAEDKHPYAWFETDDNDRIIRSYFAKENGLIEYGLHDQSLFLLDFDFARKYLDGYRKALQIPLNNDEDISGVNEMKLLDSFEYLKKNGFPCAKCIRISKDKVLSFNTQKELDEIKTLINGMNPMGGTLKYV